MLKGYSNGKYAQKTKTPVEIEGNYHTHNYLCGHAGGTVSDYAEEALRNGLSELGISDHCKPPIGSAEPYLTPYDLDDEYLPQFDEARKSFGDRLKIYSGAEIEYFDGYDEYYKTLLQRLDYLVLGQHVYLIGDAVHNSFCDGIDEQNLLAYFDNVKAGLRSGYFSLLAHPDLIFYRSPELTSRIVDAFESVVITAKRCGVPLELNANGIRNHAFRYPTELLIELCKKHNSPVAVSADAHTPSDLCDRYVKDLYAFAIDNGLDIKYTLDIKKQ